MGATYFMTYHTILKESPDYIHALRMARALADNITQATQHKVFAYRSVADIDILTITVLLLVLSNSAMRKYL